MLQYLFVAIGICVYERTQQSRRPRNREWPLAERVWQHGCKCMTQVGDWIDRITKPASERRRRQVITTAMRRHHHRTTQLFVLSALAMQVNAIIATEHQARFDTDSGSIGIDNRCSACISHLIEDFEPGLLKPCNRVVKGFGGSRTTNIKTGTIVWSWEDDAGVVTKFRIPNSYYVPEGKVRLLSPQHWAQTQATSRHKRANYSERTDGNSCVLRWD